MQLGFAAHPSAADYRITPTGTRDNHETYRSGEYREVQQDVQRRWHGPLCPGKFKSALRKPQSAQKAALPQNCPTATRIVPLLWSFVNIYNVILWLMILIASCYEKEKPRLP